MESMVLNDKQKIAVSHNTGPMMVLAGPGSGKTTVIIHRIKNLIEKYNVIPSDILVITFTKAAANEMKNRFSSICSSGTGSVSFGTFHSYFFRILRDFYGYKLENVLREEEKKVIINQIISRMELFIEDEEEFVNNIINEISLVKNELADVEFYSSNSCGDSDFRAICNEYRRVKGEFNKIDFDDMLTECYSLLKENKEVLKKWKGRYKYVLVDEFQDINKAQYECIKLLVPESKNLFIVGDDDQSIYKFRGARPEFLLKFPKDFPDTEKIILDVNYRSTQQIIKLSNEIIKGNKNRYAKVIRGTQKDGNVPILIRTEDIGSEAMEIANKIDQYRNKVDLNRIAVIYRTNIQARAIVDAFMDHNIPYQIKDETPSIYEHRISKDIFAYLNLILDSKNNSAVERIINKPKRYISKAIISEAKKKCGDGYLLNALYDVKDIKSWQTERLDEMIYNLNAAKKKNTYDVFKYIRKVIGYDDYIKEYAVFRKVNPKALYEIIDEIQESAKGYEKIEDYLAHVENVLAEIKEKKKMKNKPSYGVVLSTMHSAKGLEFDIVFVTSAVEGVIPHEKSRSEDEIEEERRLFYVAITRAKKLLFISIVKTRYEQPVVPTRFLNRIIKTKPKNLSEISKKPV